MSDGGRPNLKVWFPVFRVTTDSWSLPMSTIEYPMALTSFCRSLRPNVAVDWDVFTLKGPSRSSNDQFSCFL